MNSSEKNLRAYLRAFIFINKSPSLAYSITIYKSLSSKKASLYAIIYGLSMLARIRISFN